MRRLGLAALCGAVSTLAMAPFHFGPVLLATLPVLVWLLEGASGRATRTSVLRTGFADGWAFGLGYHLVGLFWIGEAFLVEADVFAWLLPFAVTALPAALAIFWGIATAIVAIVWWARGGPEGRILWRIGVLALALGAAEWLRGHLFTGFPWNVLGYALTMPLVLMQSAGLVGIYGLTILTVLVFAGPLVGLAASGTGRDSLIRACVVPVAIVLALAAYGAGRLAPTPPPLEAVKMRIVQPSVPQKEKWRPELQRRFFEDHLALSGGIANNFDGVTHVVWPEASMPFGPLRSPEALGMIGARVPDHVMLIAGALRADDEILPGRDRPRAYNSMIVLGPPRAMLAAIYDKIHLVPFGEYLPFQATLEAIGLEQLSRMRGGFTPGRSPRPVIAIDGLPPVGVLICYEAIFPAAVVQGRVRPGLLLNLTNDGWFGNTTGPRQHFHQSRVRAVEEGLSLVRAANNGISGVIDPYGRVIARIELNARAAIDTTVPQAASPPLYARFGDLIFAMFLGLGVASLIVARNWRAAVP